MSFVSDAYGRVVAERRSDAATGTLVARVPSALSTATLYARVGDLFGWTCVAAWLGLAVAMRRRPNRRAAVVAATSWWLQHGLLTEFFESLGAGVFR